MVFLLKKAKTKAMKNPTIFEWEEILQGPPTRVCPRETETEWFYHCHKKRKTLQFGSIENYLRIATNDPFEDVVFLKNIFPYKCPRDIRHYVAWIKQGRSYTPEQVLILARERFPNCEVAAWENIPTNRSINGIRHYQVFVRPSF